MPEFDTSHVKNIVLLGHAGSGKTTLAECMLYRSRTNNPPRQHSRQKHNRRLPRTGTGTW